MQAEQHLRFGPYCFAPGSGQLRRGTHEVKLTPKALALLRVLVMRAGQVVTKDELFQTMWLDTVVSDDALTSCIQELRQALRDDARKPRFIETVHRRGFRFLPAVTTSPPVQDLTFQVPSQDEGVRSQYPVISRGEEKQQGTENDSLESSVQSLEPKTPSTPSDDVQTLDPRRQTLDVSAAPASSRFSRSVVLVAVLLLTATILLVQYLSRSPLSPQPLLPNPLLCPTSPRLP